MTSRRPVITAAALCAVLALAGGCSNANGKEPDPTPTTLISLPPMTTDPTDGTSSGEGESGAPLDQRTADEQAAKDIYREYITRFNAAAHTGFEDPALTDRVGEFLGGDERLYYFQEVVPGLRGTGIHTEGDRVIKSMDVVEYTPGDGTGAGTTVVLTACIDDTGVTLHQEDGTQVEVEGEDTEPYELEVRLFRAENLLVYDTKGTRKTC